MEIQAPDGTLLPGRHLHLVFEIADFAPLDVSAVDREDIAARAVLDKEGWCVIILTNAVGVPVTISENEPVTLLITPKRRPAGLSTEVVTFFRARGVKKVGEGGGDGTENIRVHLGPLENLDGWIGDRRRAGCLIDYKIYAALYFVVRSR